MGESPEKDHGGKSEDVRDPARLIANLTHELKTPLHSMLAVAGLLANQSDGPLNAEQIRQVDVILRNGNQLLDLINNLLHYSSSESRPLSYGRFSLRIFLQEILTGISPLVQRGGLKVEEVLDLNEEIIASDRTLLRQIFSNLLGNAVKFSPSGGVIVVAARSAEDGWFEFQIADSGIGIESQLQAQVFSEFYQIEAGDARRFGGVGLGLALVRSAVLRLGGEISLASEAGQGALFTVRIPSREDLVPRRKIVLYEGEAGLRLALVEAFKAQGDEPEVSERAEDLLVLAASGPDVVVLGLDLRRKEEAELLRRLAETVRPQQTPLIVMSAAGEAEERIKAFDLGASDFIKKPFDLKEIELRISMHTRGSGE